MWREEIDIIIKDGGLHDIDLKDGNVVTFMVKGVRYYGKYCIIADSRTNSANSYWIERVLTISKIKAIDGVSYNQSFGHLNYLRKCEEERKGKEEKNRIANTSVDSGLTGTKLGCMGFFGMLGLIIGGAAFGGLGAIGGIIAGSLFANWFVDERFKE